MRRYLNSLKLGTLALTSFMLHWVSVNPARSIQTLRYDSAGSGVKKIQERLVSAGFLENRQVDGIFGRQTEAALREFQHYQGLPPDGVLGPQTYEALERQILLPQGFEQTTVPKNSVPVGFIVVVVTLVVVAATTDRPNCDSTYTLAGNVLNVTLIWRGYKFHKLKAYIDEKPEKIEGKTEKVLTEKEKKDGKAKFILAIVPESSELKLECFEEDSSEPVVHISPIKRGN